MSDRNEIDHEATLREMSIASADDEDQWAAEWALDRIEELEDTITIQNNTLLMQSQRIEKDRLRIRELTAERDDYDPSSWTSQITDAPESVRWMT